MKYQGEKERVPLRKADIELIQKRLGASYKVIWISFAVCVLISGIGFYATGFIGIPVVLFLVFLMFTGIFLYSISQFKRDLSSGLKHKISGLLTNKDIEVSPNPKSRAKSYYFYIGTEKVRVPQAQYDLFPIADEITVYLALHSKMVLEIRNDTR